MKCTINTENQKYILFCDPGRNGRQNKGGKGGAKNYQAFIAGKKPGPEPVVASKVRYLMEKSNIHPLMNQNYFRKLPLHMLLTRLEEKESRKM